MSINYTRIDALFERMGVDAFRTIFEEFCCEMRLAFPILTQAIDADDKSKVCDVFEQICCRASYLGMVGLVNACNDLQSVVETQCCRGNVDVTGMMQIYSEAAGQIDRKYIQSVQQLGAAT